MSEDVAREMLERAQLAAALELRATASPDEIAATIGRLLDNPGTEEKSIVNAIDPREQWKTLAETRSAEMNPE